MLDDVDADDDHRERDWRAESNRNSKASKLARVLARAMFKVKLFHLSGLRLKRNTEKAESHAIIATIELATFPWVFLFSAIRHRGVAFGHLPCPVAQQARPQLSQVRAIYTLLFFLAP
ncbi:hypothetical protein T09_5428 [Trichinella sp. T9]|nr:hypothetical protein T09_5428 [Trichinella sp. T9]